MSTTMLQFQTLAATLLGGASPAERIRIVEEALAAEGGKRWRSQIGEWIVRFVPVETLVPEEAARWRPLVRDAIRFVFSRLSARRLATKIVEQIELPPDTPAESRLLRLIGKMPGLQKLGQVLARNPRLAPSLRTALTELENGISDATAQQIRTMIVDQLGTRLQTYSVELEPEILSEASVSAVLRFTWRHPGREREIGVFKVLKAHIPACFAEDMTLLQQLANYIASKEGGYTFAVKEVSESLAEVRLLLEHELDYQREQATLLDAWRTYRSSIGIRVPRLIKPLCTPTITAMSAERGVKVTAAFPRSPIRRRRVAEQLVEALITVPLFSREKEAVFHADPHAGNLFYDEPNRELILLDWALAQRLTRESRRQLVLLAVMMILRNRAGVSRAIQLLSIDRQRRKLQSLIERGVEHFFRNIPVNHVPGALDAMKLLDDLAFHGVRFPPSLFLFRKILFTLDGVLHDVAGPGVRIDRIIAREFLTRWAASFGLFHAPLAAGDFVSLQWNALLYPARSWVGRRLAASQGAMATGSGQSSRGSIPSLKRRSPRRGKPRRPAPRWPQSRPAG